MQCNHNQTYCGPNFYPSYGQYTPHNPPLYHHPQPQPIVAGEGDVATVVNPDGSLQFLFVPTRRWPTDDPYRTIGPPYCGPEAWLIKSISNPVPAASFLQPYPRIAVPLYRTDYSPGYNCPPTAPYQVQFHNDGCTSTTDLHYFYPNLRYCPWIPKVCADGAAQAKPPQQDAQCSPPSILKNPSVEWMSVDDTPQCSRQNKTVHFDFDNPCDRYKKRLWCDCRFCECDLSSCQCSDSPLVI